MQKSFHQMKGDVGMHNAKNHRNKSLHSKMIKIQSCITPPYIIQVQGLRIHLAMKTSCSYDFSHCASLHHLSFDEDEMIFALVFMSICPSNDCIVIS